MKHVLPLPPSANRYFRIWRNRAVLSDEARAYKQMVQAWSQGAQVQPMIGPVCVSVTIYRARRAGDLDNRLKVLFDAMQHIFYENDAQVREIHATLADDKRNPRAEVEVTALPVGSVAGSMTLEVFKW